MRFVKSIKKQGKDEVHVVVAMSCHEYNNYRYGEQQAFFNTPTSSVLTDEELMNMALNEVNKRVVINDKTSTV